MQPIKTPESYAHLADMSQTERRQWLDGHADRIIGDETYVRPLTESEDEQLRHDFAHISKTCLSHERAKKRFNDKWTLETKEDMAQLKNLGRRLLTNMIEVTEDLYEITDPEERMVYSFNGKGDCVSQRRAGVSDLEGTIFSALRDNS